MAVGRNVVVIAAVGKGKNWAMRIGVAARTRQERVVIELW